MITTAVSVLLLSLLLGLWVAAWLHWFFIGDLRQFVIAYFSPAGWRAGRLRGDVLLLDTDDFELFLAAESQAPGFVRGVLGCPGCFSNYVSIAGLPLVYFAFSPSYWALPLIWAAGAYIGHRLHNAL